MEKKQIKKKTGMSHEQRQLRRNQVIFSIIAVIVILSWIISLVAK
jgi:hypothetical protein